MSAKRSVRISARITDDQGVEKTYDVLPIPQVDLRPEEIKGYHLRHGTDVYRCAMNHEGVIRCDCKGFQKWMHCKHVGALAASELLPVGLMSIIQERNEILQADEKIIRRLREEINHLKSICSKRSEEEEKCETASQACACLPL